MKSNLSDMTAKGFFTDTVNIISIHHKQLY
jgi:hypothetical protein